MTLRECEYCLKLNAARGDAVSLWIDAGYKREAEIPEGQTDAFWEDKHPSTHYYAVASGTQHLNPALARALRDRNSAVALRAIRSLNEIVGATNLFGGDQSPLIDALRYGDRQVRFEAAFAVAQALPQKNFPGAERVVPILAEALPKPASPASSSSPPLTRSMRFASSSRTMRSRAARLPKPPYPPLHRSALSM